MRKLTVFFIWTFSIVHTTPVSYNWNLYKKEHSKNYPNASEDSRRMNVYLENAHEIARHNELYDKGLVSFKMKLNTYSDWSLIEFVTSMNGFRRPAALKSNQTTKLSTLFVGLESAILPKSVDWRKKGAVTSVKEQGHCGSCWAFAAAGSLEAQKYRKTGRLVSLSVQNLVDCLKTDGKRKCSGRTIHAAFDYLKRNDGIESEKTYPYKAVGASCKYDPRDSAVSIRKYVDIPEDNEKALQEAIATVGPIAVGIDASHKSFQFYSSGIYREPKCNPDDIDHAMLVVGYGTDKHGKDHYILKNSWGTDWGENGYMRIARNHNNSCGIASNGVYPVI